jgi:hypothetical protein
VAVTAGGSRQLTVNYLEASPGKQIRREDAVEVHRISFQTRILNPADKKLEVFSFLGLQGDFEIYVDRTTRIPVQISGQIPGIGNLDIRLDEVLREGLAGLIESPDKSNDCDRKNPQSLAKPAKHP